MNAVRTEREKSMVKRRIYNLILMIVGAALVALSINLFFLALKIAPGGVSGLATVLHYVLGFPMGALVIALNIPLFLMGVLTFGKKFIAKTIFATLVMSVVLDTTVWLPQLTQDMLLASIFGGGMMGLGLALVFKGGATTGGTDIAAKVVNYFFPAFKIGEQLFVIDALVVITAMIVFRDFDIGFYSIITIWISAKVIDLILSGVGYSKALFIISNESEKISQQILEEVKRGVTALQGKGMYTHTDKKILMTVVDQRQIPMIKQIAKDLDKNAFIIITDVREALGNGFSKV